MYGTTGMHEIDWLVGDQPVIPPAEERLLQRRIVACRAPIWRSEVFYPVPDVAPPPCLRTGQLTFGCFHRRTS